MNSIAQDAKRSGTYEYKHMTNHDYDILQHEYKLALEISDQRELIDKYLQGAYHLLCEASLRREEHEALQRFMEKWFIVILRLWLASWRKSCQRKIINKFLKSA